MSAPKRVQLSRAKGWRKPEGAVVVARPSKWGNPFRVGQSYVHGRCAGNANTPYPQLLLRGGTPVRDRAHAVELFRAHIAFEDDGVWAPAYVRAELAGKDLACWCPLDQPCHADVLLELAR